MDVTATIPVNNGNNVLNILNNNGPLDELLNAGNNSAIPPVTDTTLGTSMSAQQRQAHDLKVLQTVAKSLDFTRLLMIQRSLAETYRSAYFAVRHLPTSAMEVRKHAVAMRDLQGRVRTVMQRCRNLSQSILVILPDLTNSVLEGDVGLTQAIFGRMRQWVSELRNEAQSMQEQHSALILDVQMSLERAQALAALDHGHITAWNEHNTANMLEGPDTGRSDDSNNPNNNNMRQDSINMENEGITPISLVATPLSSIDGNTIPRMETNMSVGSPLSISSGTGIANDELNPGMTTDEGDAFLQLFLDPATVVTDGRKLKRILTSMGENIDELSAYTNKHTLSSTSPPPTTTINSVRKSSVNSTDMNHHHYHHEPMNNKSRTGSVGETGSTPLSGSLPNSPLREPIHDHNLHRTMSPTNVSSLNTNNNSTTLVRGTNNNNSSIGRQIFPDVHNHNNNEYHNHNNHSTALVNDPLSQAIQPSSQIISQDVTTSASRTGNRSGACLACALQDLRQVDVILSQAVEFWASMELVIDVVVRRKEHSETLLAYSSSSRMMNKAITSLSEYQAFWQAFTYLCSRYEDSLSAETRNMYSWLSTPLPAVPGAGIDSRLMVTMDSFSPVSDGSGNTPGNGSGNNGAIVPLPISKAILNGPNPYLNSPTAINIMNRPPLSPPSITSPISNNNNGIMNPSITVNSRPSTINNR